MFDRILSFAFCLLCISLSSSFAQAPVGSSSTKIAVINSYAFGDEKAGISRFVEAIKSVNAPFVTVNTDLNTMNTRLQTLAKEIQTAREQLARGVAVDEKNIQTKIDEAEKLQREIKFKQEDAKAQYEKRYQSVVGPVMQAIGTGLRDYAKLKGFGLIFDASKDERGFLVAIGDEKVDVTKDFIAFYNARNTAAPSAKP